MYVAYGEIERSNETECIKMIILIFCCDNNIIRSKFHHNVVIFMIIIKFSFMLKSYFFKIPIQVVLRAGHLSIKWEYVSDGY